MGILSGKECKVGGVKVVEPKKGLNIVKECGSCKNVFKALEKDEKFEKLRASSDSFDEDGKLWFDWKAVYEEIDKPNINEDVKIEFPKLDEDKIKKLTAENDSLADLSKSLNVQIEDLEPSLDELKRELKENKADLKEIVKANEKEESKLRSNRKKIESEVKKPDISAYMRIRKAKKGKAVATIKRSACSGCHNVVPSQRQLDIRQNNKLYLCDYCGRI